MPIRCVHKIWVCCVLLSCLFYLFSQPVGGPSPISMRCCLCLLLFANYYYQMLCCAQSTCVVYSILILSRPHIPNSSNSGPTTNERTSHLMSVCGAFWKIVSGAITEAIPLQFRCVPSIWMLDAVGVVVIDVSNPHVNMLRRNRSESVTQ